MAPRLATTAQERWRRTLGAACAALGVSVTGCASLIADAGIGAAQEAAGSLSTIHDFEIGRTMLVSSLSQLEGFHSLSPGNRTGLVLLTRAWTSVGMGFLEDDYEEAYQAGDTELAEYQARRERAAFARARYYGVEALALQADGFDAVRGNAGTLRAWVEERFDSRKDAPLLLWTGVAWLAHAASGARDHPAAVGEIYVGAELIRRSVALDPGLEFALGETMLGAYHARSALAELGESKVHFERALAMNHGKFLTTKLLFAQRYHCVRGDRVSYERTLREIIDEPDSLPEARLQNAVAKRLAHRYLEHRIWQEECGFSR